MRAPLGTREFRLLGPVEALADGAPLRLGGRRQRTLLALLLLEPGRAVPADRLVDELWEGTPPAGAATTLRSYLSRLRSALGPGTIEARPPGYAVAAGPEQLDAVRFERLLREGREALGRGAAGLAADRLGAALALWRGPALADVAATGALALEARRLEELRLVCVEQRIEAELALGRHARLVPELERLVAEEPLRERLWRQLVLALYRSGRQADALAAQRQARERLDELGLEPGEDLRELERAVLRHEVAPAPVAEKRHNVPAATTSFVGRERELDELARLLRRHRLVTLTGIGGAGKTRLALELASSQIGAWPGGVWFVDLATLSEPALLPGTVAAAIGIDERPGPAAEALADELRAAELLLLLDNCEHLADPCADLAETLLQGCPDVHVLATSRIPLALAGEAEYAIDPLGFPGERAAREEIAASPAVRLFLDRGRAVRRDLPDDEQTLVAAGRICRELDGLPLAIELAATRAKALSLEEIAGHLGDRFRFLRAWRRVADPRHRTLQATMDWSHDLLSGDERALLRRLSVFAGGFTLESVAAVCLDGDEQRALEQLGRLVDASLVRAEGRYRLLETVRQYAAERLAEDDEPDEVRRALAEWLLSRAEALHLVEPSMDAVELVPELANIRAALAWCVESEPELGLRLAVALEGFWVAGSPTEGLRRLEELLERAPVAPDELRARALRACGSCANPAGEDDAAERYYAASHAAFRALGDEPAAAVLLLRLGYSALYRGDTAHARQLGDESLAAFTAAGSRRHEAQSIGLLGETAYADGDRPGGLELMQRSADQAGEAGFEWWRAKMLTTLAGCLRENGDRERAAACAREAATLSLRLRDRRRLLRALARLALIEAERGEHRRAGLIWGAIDAEQARGPLGDWEAARPGFERAVLPHADLAFAEGRELGRTLPADAVI